MAEKIIGIDLGTTNSCVAVMEGNQSVVIQNSEGRRTTPSVVAIDKKGEHLIGELARRQGVTNPRNTIYSIKRMMGRTYSEVQDEIKDYPYEVIRRNDGIPAVKMGDKEFTSPEISAQILTKMKKTAEDYLGQEVKKAVITVPAYFNDSQRQATKDAGRIAGLEVLRIVNEPTAASLAYGLDKKANVNIAVYDLGGGTFDISILELGDGVFEVKSTNGDTFLGGDNFDHALMDYVAVEFKKESGVDLRSQPVSLQRLKEACQSAKCELSTVTETQINLPFVAQDSDGQPVHLDMTISRPKFEQLISHYIDKSIDCCRQAIKDADLGINEINEVLLVGGSTRIPRVQEAVKNFFNREPSKGVNPDEVVAMGAAIQAGILGGEVKDILLLDVTPLTWGIETLGGVCTPIIAANTTIPCKYSEVFSTAADNQSSVEIHVLQGERKFARDNKSVGRFTLNELPPAPRGVPQIEVTFDISADGTLNVSAVDKATQKSNNIVIKADSGLSDAEIEKMRREAKEHEDEDNRRKEMVDAVNHGDSLAYEIERQLKENGDKITAEQKSEVELNIGRVREAIKGSDVHEIKSATEALQESWHKIARDLYQAQGGQPGGSCATGAAAGAEAAGQAGPSAGGAASASKGSDDDDIIDAEVEK